MNLPTKTANRRRKFFIFALLGFAFAGSLLALYRYQKVPPQYHYEASSTLAIDLSSPDTLLLTQNLSQLPKDVTTAPILSGLVDEALVFHYEENEERLSIEGSLRRIAFEHKLEWQDRFLSTLFDAPAEIAFWQSKKGRPDYFVAQLERGTLGKLTEALAKIALDDTQLQKAAELKLEGKTIPLYALRYAGGRSLIFAGHGDQWLALSHPGMVFNSKGELTADAKVILGALLQGKRPWQDKLPATASAKHSALIGSKAITLGYEHFLSGVGGLRFDFQNKKWSSALRLMPPDGISYQPDAIWRLAPLGAALCVALPVNWAATTEPLTTLTGEAENVKAVLASLDPVAAACWYPDSRLAAPLFIARAKAALPPQTAQFIDAVASKAWRASIAPKPEEGGNATRFSLNLPSQHGLFSKQDKARSFPVSLAYQGTSIYFSPDQSLVEAALNVPKKLAPALADEVGLKKSALAWLVLDPAAMAKLVRAEVQEALPANDESFFREVAQKELWPRLEAWSKQQKAFALVPGKNERSGFVALNAQPLKSQ